METTWKQRTALGAMSIGLLLGGAYTGTDNPSFSIGQEVSAAEAKSFSATRYKTKANLNMRSGASTKFKVLLTIPNGTHVQSATKVGNWYKVTYKGKTGYVSGTYLSKVTAAPSVTTPSASYQTTDNLNMRTGASVNHKRILTIPKGGKVTYVSKSGSWFKVKYGTKTGYVSSKYLKKTTTAKPAPPAEAGKQYLTTADLNMRTNGSVYSKRILTIPMGKQVKYIGKSGGWYKIQYGSQIGYVNAKYLKTVPLKVPAIKQKVMSRAEAEVHMAKHLMKDKSGSYRLTTPIGRDAIILGFESSTTGKANFALDVISYYSAMDVKPEDIGTESYELNQVYLVKMKEAIAAYAETQFGRGTAEAKKLESEIKHMAANLPRGAVKKLSLQGKTVTLMREGSSVLVKY